MMSAPENPAERAARVAWSMSSAGTAARAASNSSRRRVRSGGGMLSERGTRGLAWRPGSTVERREVPSTTASPDRSAAESRNHRNTAPNWVR